MPTGNVKWFDTKKGYGFIIGDEGEDVFVHYTSIVGDGFRSLKDGETVDYDVVQSGKGLQARNVRRTAPDEGTADAAEPPRPDESGSSNQDRPGHPESQDAPDAQDESAQP